VSYEVAPPVSIWIFPVLGFSQFDQKAYNGAKQDLFKALAILDTHFKHNTFFVGNGVTLADIVGACTLLRAFELLLDPVARENYPSLTRWFTTCVNQPQFKAVMGNVVFAEVEAQPKDIGGAQQSGKKEKSKKESVSSDASGDAGKAGNKKKEKKPEKKPEKKVEAEPEDLEEEEDFEAAEKPKGKNPLDSLPKSKMILDAVKREFSNNDYADAINTFWTNYDPEGYSLWQGAYNYNSENTVYFMTCNLIGGYIQRLESLRKYGFGALMIAGDDQQKPPFDIWALFLVRGKTMPPELKECPDSEYYTWSELKSDSPADRKRIDELWNSERINGKYVHERRFYK